MVEQPCERRTVEQFGALPVHLQPLLAQPVQRKGAAGLDVVIGQSPAYVHREFEISPRHETPGLRRADVRLHEVGTRHAVLVGEYQVVGRRGDERLVEYPRLLETVVLMPYMPDRKPVAERVYQLAGPVVRAVVGYDYLVGGPGLEQIAPECLLKPLRVVVGRYHDAHAECF